MSHTPETSQWSIARPVHAPVLAGVALLLMALNSAAHAICKPGRMINPVSDVAWQCIFPISIMGIPFDGGNHPPDNDTTDVFCDCPGKDGSMYGFGFVVTFWEPARMVDTVTDAWCFPGIGMDWKGTTAGAGYTGGGELRYSEERIAYQNYHYYIMPIWALLELFSDIPCIGDGESFDIAMVSEVRPDWHRDLLAAQLYPETALMANPFVVMACTADAVMATAERPIDALYWCMGAWGTTYPMTGHITASDYVEANAGIAGKAMYLQARTAMLGDRAANFCGTTYLPIWIKSHWRMQEVDPVADSQCHSIGHPGILWTGGKGPVGQMDNYSWLLFRKVKCCVPVT
jgi:conjugal transfer pilus assembly protein TraU